MNVTSNTTAGQGAGSKQLLFFQSGGRRFATLALTVRDIAGADWHLPPAKNGGTRGQLVNLAELLQLPAGKPTRTLILENETGTWGFAVEDIPRDHLQAYPITPLPAVLSDWSRPCVLAGFCQEGDSLCAVLDLEALARGVAVLIQCRGDHASPSSRV